MTKILITGATGAIGKAALEHCLANPKVASVVALVRRPLPEHLSSNEKLESAIVEDFGHIPEDILRAHSDADAMLWMIGTYDTDPAPNYEYPITFHRDFLPILQSNASRSSAFRFICLGGHFVEPDQDKSLYFLNDARKIKGKLQSESIQFAHDHKDLWKSFFVRPLGVITPQMWGKGAINVVLGKGLVVRAEELAAYMTYIALGGEAAETIHNRCIAEKGRALLKESQRQQESAGILRVVQ